MSSGNGVKHIVTDILVIGGGMAGCFAAIKAKEQGLDVTLTDKGYVGKSGGAHYAEGDIVFFRPERGHKLDQWLNLISERGEYVNNREWDEICLKESKDRYNDLVSWGVPFYEENGKLYVNRGSGTGRASVYENISMRHRQAAPVLRKKALAIGVRVLDRIVCCELLKQDGKVVGAAGLHTTSGDLYVFQAKAIVIATGGSSLKAVNHPSHYWAGDGEAMAYRAGAEIASMEFSRMGGMGSANRAVLKQREQIGKISPISGNIIDAMARYPASWGGTTGWFSPSLNAEGGAVVGLAWEAHCGRAPIYVDLDAYTTERIEWVKYFLRRQGSASPEKIGIDFTKGGKAIYPASKVPTISVPAGSGIWPENTSCATRLPGLYAAGNSCATMGSGALYAGMGFGLNHAMVTGNRAGRGAAEYASKSKKTKLDKAELTRLKEIVCAPMGRQGGFSPGWLMQVFHGFTVPYFILGVKHGERLQAALTLIEFLNSHLVPKLMARDPHEWRMAYEVKNMALIAEMRIKASLFRTESRGSHYREDYPRRDDPAWLAWVKLKEERGRMHAYKEPIPKKWWPDLTKPYEERYPNAFPLE